MNANDDGAKPLDEDQESVLAAGANTSSEVQGSTNPSEDSVEADHKPKVPADKKSNDKPSKMHELFLCAIIPEDNLQLVMRMLQGYCGMSPVSFIRREQIWEGPRNRNALKSLDPNFIQRQEPERQKQWRHLSEALSRQAFMVTLTYEIGKSSFGEAEGKAEHELVPIEFDKIPGTLRWNDVPDTTSARPTTLGRPIVEIANERNLHMILKSMNHRFAREFIKEGYRFVHGHVLFELFRMITLHPQGEISNLGNPLPPFESLTLFDAANQWCLMASVKVELSVDRTELGQKLNRQATDELIGIKTAFEDQLSVSMLWIDCPLILG